MELLIQEGTAIDVNYFDQIVSNLYNVGSDQTHPDQSEANSILMKFQERKDAWLVVQEVITNSHNTTSKFIALQTFTKGAQTNWEMIDENQRNFLKKFYFDLFFQWCTENTEAILMTEVSRALIEILKNEWPTYWPTFMHDFIQNCNRNEYTILYGYYFAFKKNNRIFFPTVILKNGQTVKRVTAVNLPGLRKSGGIFEKQSNIPDAIWNDIILNCFNPNPNERPTFAKLADTIESNSQYWFENTNENEFKKYVNMMKNLRFDQ